MEETSLTFQHLKKLENVNFPIHSILSEKKGIQLYKTNQVLRDIATFMEHPESYSFFKKYLENETYFHHIFSILKLYDIITKNLLERNIEFNAYHKIFLVYMLINNPKYNYLIFKNSRTIDEKKYLLQNHKVD